MGPLTAPLTAPDVALADDGVSGRQGQTSRVGAPPPARVGRRGGMGQGLRRREELWGMLRKEVGWMGEVESGRCPPLP